MNSITNYIILYIIFFLLILLVILLMILILPKLKIYDNIVCKCNYTYPNIIQCECGFEPKVKTDIELLEDIIVLNNIDKEDIVDRKTIIDKEDIVDRKTIIDKKDIVDMIKLNRIDNYNSNISNNSNIPNIKYKVNKRPIGMKKLNRMDNYNSNISNNSNIPNIK